MTDAIKNILKDLGFKDIDKHESVDDYIADLAANHKMHEELHEEKTKELGTERMATNELKKAHLAVGDMIDLKHKEETFFIDPEFLKTCRTFNREEVLKKIRDNNVCLGDMLEFMKENSNPPEAENENISQVQSETDNS